MGSVMTVPAYTCARKGWARAEGGRAGGRGRERRTGRARGARARGRDAEKRLSASGERGTGETREGGRRRAAAADAPPRGKRRTRWCPRPRAAGGADARAPPLPLPPQRPHRPLHEHGRDRAGRGAHTRRAASRAGEGRGSTHKPAVAVRQVPRVRARLQRVGDDVRLLHRGAGGRSAAARRRRRPGAQAVGNAGAREPLPGTLRCLVAQRPAVRLCDVARVA